MLLHPLGRRSFLASKMSKMGSCWWKSQNVLEQMTRRRDGHDVAAPFLVCSALWPLSFTSVAPLKTQNPNLPGSEQQLLAAQGGFRRERNEGTSKTLVSLQTFTDNFLKKNSRASNCGFAATRLDGCNARCASSMMLSGKSLRHGGEPTRQLEP